MTERLPTPLLTRMPGGCRRLCSRGGPFPGQMFYLKKCTFWGPGLSSIELNSEGKKTQFFKNLLFFEASSQPAMEAEILRVGAGLGGGGGVGPLLYDRNPCCSPRQAASHSCLHPPVTGSSLLLQAAHTVGGQSELSVKNV